MNSLISRPLVATLCLFVLFLAAPLMAADKPEAPKAPEGIAGKTAGMEKKEGLLTFYVDRKAGKIWLEVPKASGPGGEVASYIYSEGLLTGLGSNPVGLDRGQLGEAKLVTLRRLGGRVLLEQPNLRFRALSDNPDETRTVRESFATSVLWAGEVAATEPDGRVLVDFTSFLLRDAHDVASQLRQTEQGNWSLDAGRSVLDFENCLAFPENLEFEALLTWQSNEPGPLVRQTAPTAGAVSLVQHHSLLKLPAPDYEPRPYDPRAGSFSTDFLNYAAPLDEPIDTRWIVRFRLEKTDPTAERSRVRKPIVFYIDSGAPEPVRSALLEGAGWWREAFEKAGFIHGYRVELLPPGIHPLDARYNVVQWVHRATRGWSYGGGLVDPRTGEAINGHVTLGSLRVRQDRLIFEGLAGTEKTGTGAPDDPVMISLARIRQLAAHEVGHALGLNHNFAASTYGRASVMDYPHPLIGITSDGKLDFSSAYARGVGPWDVFAIRYAYSQFPPGTDVPAALDAMVQEALGNGLLFLTDEDARPAGSADPRATLWDNGSDPVEGLRHALAVRKIGLAHFGEHNIAPGRPLALLQEVLVPLYFHHRYQLDAALKAVGGLEYTYALRGDRQPPAQPVDAGEQRQALAAILETLSPEVLDLPDPVIALLLPRPAGYRPNEEMFRGAADPVFDPLSAAAAVADMAVQGLLVPERTARLVDFHRRDPKLPGLEDVLGGLVEKAFGGAAPANARQAELRRVVQWVVVRRLIGLSDNREASSGVRARVDAELRALRQKLAAGAKGAKPDDAEAAQRAFLADEIGRYLDRPETKAAERPQPPPPPPGQPIGSAPMAAPEGLPEGLSGCSWEG